MNAHKELTKTQQRWIAAAAGIITIAVIAYICIYIGELVGIVNS